MYGEGNRRCGRQDGKRIRKISRISKVGRVSRYSRYSRVSRVRSVGYLVRWDALIHETQKPLSYGILVCLQPSLASETMNLVSQDNRPQQRESELQIAFLDVPLPKLWIVSNILDVRREQRTESSEQRPQNKAQTRK